MRTLRILVVLSVLFCNVCSGLFNQSAFAQSLTATDAVLFQDDFTANTNEWSLGYSRDDVSTDETRIVDGKLQKQVGFMQDAISWVRIPNFLAQNFHLTVEAALVEATSEYTQITLTFREDADGNYYLIQFDSDNSYLVQLYYNDEWQTLQDWTTSAAIDLQPGVVNQFSLRVEDSFFTIYANGEELTTIENATLRDAGEIGLGIGGSQGEEAMATFDNLLLTGSASQTVPSVDEQIAAIHHTSPLISDEFRTVNEDWYMVSSEVVRYDYIDRAFQIMLRRENQLTWSVNRSLMAADFLVEFDVVQLAGISTGEAGVVFRLYDTDNFYYFAINAEGEYALNRKLNGEWTILVDWTASDKLKTGKRTNNRLGVLAQGNQIALMANDTTVAQLTDDAVIQGHIGFAVGTGEHPIQKVLFDNLDFWQLRAAQITYPSPAPTPATIAIEPDLATIRDVAPPLSEDFRQDNGQWTVTADESKTYSYNDRTFRIEVHQPNTFTWSQSAQTESANMLVETDVTYFSGPEEAEFGLLFRYVDQHNFYAYIISSLGTYSLWKQVDGTWEQLLPWTASEAIVTGTEATNRIGVLADGNEITLVVNDVGVAQTIDNTFSHGQVGIAVGSTAETGPIVLFDNLDLWPLE